jgi:hypothetical protein
MTRSCSYRRATLNPIPNLYGLSIVEPRNSHYVHSAAGGECIFHSLWDSRFHAQRDARQQRCLRLRQDVGDRGLDSGLDGE